jgi:hypothetical protein
MAIPALPPTADTRTISERVNVLVRDFNGRRTAVTVATLPASPAVGEMWLVTDATAATFGATVVGGGAVVAPVFWNGTAWVTG